MNQLLEQALRLPVAERIRLADELYMSVGEPANSTALTDAPVAEIERRLEEYERHPGSSIPLEEFLSRFEAR